MPPGDRTLVDTACPSDAVLCGFDGPADFREGNEGSASRRLWLARDRQPAYVLNGPGGEVDLSWLEARQHACAILADIAAWQAGKI